MYSHVACDVMKERTLYLLKPSSLIWHLMPYLFLFKNVSEDRATGRAGDRTRTPRLQRRVVHPLYTVFVSVPWH